MPPIILLHGALGAARNMLSLCHALDPYAEVHILDFSGHGEAYWPESGFTIQTFEQDVLSLMNDRDIGAAHIFGYSMGGFIGLRLALSAPERILSVTTLATKFDWTEETCAQESRVLNADTIEAKAPKFANSLLLTHVRNGWKKVLDGTRSLLEGMNHYRFSEDDLRKIEQPVRLMLGDRDRMVRLDETQATWRSLPNGELAVLPGTPHPLEQANRDLVALLVRNRMLGK